MRFLLRALPIPSSPDLGRLSPPLPFLRPPSLALHRSRPDEKVVFQKVRDLSVLGAGRTRSGRQR
ncbi:hypothetical protein BRADI_4g02575v3 [Brachypodium distachyon]|uniref:Uncharacterized protein n=1 Tax=Brachypodium distachyon TaxID=15368 RepID=A0A2K2CK43_BRADI|nr:hypothetical protein BRADI_4g02575v3 [Brachypodium distachyon]PNT62401.1 hypothetical protein BRADI_4g02575v3 [Brachypodium distachyon]